MWQASSVRVPPVLGSAAGISMIQQLKGNRAVNQMLAVQRDNEAQGLREPSDTEIHSAAAEGIRTPTTSLPYLDRIQASFGRHSIGHVKAHIGPQAAKASRVMSALAFASGDHVVFGGAPDLRTAAHEAAHVVQQQAGVQLVGGVGRAGDAYERNADAVADAVLAGRSAEGLLQPFAVNASPKTEAVSRFTQRRANVTLEDQIWEISRRNPGGFTRHTYGLDKPAAGFCVAYEDTQDCYGRDGLARALKHAQTHSQIIGGWFYTGNNRYYFDSVRVYSDIRAAIDAAIREKQIGLYNLSGTYVEIRDENNALKPEYEKKLARWEADREKTSNFINWAEGARNPGR